MYRTRSWYGLVIILIMLILPVFLPGCSCWTNLVDFKIHNNTNETLYIYLDMETYFDEVSPGKEIIWTIDRIYSDYEIIAKDSDDNVLYIANYDLQDIRRKKELNVYFPPK